MSEVFADTSYFVALLNATDRDHESAVRLTARRQERLITSTWILTELANFLRWPRYRHCFLACLRELQDDPSVIILPADEGTWRQGVDLFGQRADKEWSLTDCLSFVTMRQRSIDAALTTDAHFLQAGFRALLLE